MKLTPEQKTKIINILDTLSEAWTLCDGQQCELQPDFEDLETQLEDEPIAHLFMGEESHDIMMDDVLKSTLDGNSIQLTPSFDIECYYKFVPMDVKEDFSWS